MKLYTVCYILLQFVFIEQVLNYILDLRMEQEGSLALLSVTVGIYSRNFKCYSCKWCPNTCIKNSVNYTCIWLQCSVFILNSFFHAKYQKHCAKETAVISGKPVLLYVCNKNQNKYRSWLHCCDILLLPQVVLVNMNSSLQCCIVTYEEDWGGFVFRVPQTTWFPGQ